MSIAGKKWDEGTPIQALQTFLLEENHLKCKPPLPHDEVLKIVTSVVSYAQGEKKFITLGENDSGTVIYPVYRNLFYTLYLTT